MGSEAKTLEFFSVVKNPSDHDEDIAMAEVRQPAAGELLSSRCVPLESGEQEEEGVLLAGKYFLPPGFRFHPTDQELVLYYLKRKVYGLKMELDVIAEIDLYEFEPWDLQEVSCLQTKDLQWYFFCPRMRKYPRGNRENRATPIGRWKPSGKDRLVMSGSRLVGTRKCLIYYDRRARKEERTDWVMHEFRLHDEESQKLTSKQNNFVLCRVFKKSGRGSRRGEQYGAPLDDEEVESLHDSKISVSGCGQLTWDLQNGSSAVKESQPGETSTYDDSPSESTETEVTPRNDLCLKL